MTNTKKFTVTQYGCEDFGYGDSHEQAIADASKWICDENGQQGCSVEYVEKLLNHGNGPRVFGEFYVVDNKSE